MSNNKQNAPKQSFSGILGFILACIGASVGLGNIWRFPVMVSQFGGLTFLIPYFIFVVLVTYTGVIEEYALGRAAGKGPIGAFGWACQDKGYEKTGRALGVLPILGSIGLAIGYSVVLSWVFKYLYLAVSGQLLAMGHDVATLEATFNSTAGPWGCNLWIIIASIGCIIIMGAGVSDGIERANRVLLPILAILFVILTIYIAFLPGATDGLKYIFTLDPVKLLDPKVWIFACGQAFFSLSITGNVCVILGAYMPKDNDIPQAAFTVAIFDTVAAMLAALVVIPAMATTGVQLSIGGPGLMFIYLIDVFNNMPGGWLVEVLFFLGVTSAGLTTLVVLYEAPVALCNKKLGLSRWLTTILLVAIGAAIAICIQPLTSEWMDILSIYICPLGALLAAISFFWFLGKDKALEVVNAGAKRPVGNAFHWCGKYLFCLTTVLIIVLGALLGGIG